MGTCKSCKSTSFATAKVVLHDGTLQEFSYPIKASYILPKDSTYFICNSEDMDFDGVVKPVRDDEELQPGELYFALPKTKLLRPLLAHEMVALAVKANAALQESRSAKMCRCRKRAGFFEDGEDRERSSARVAEKSATIPRNGNRNKRNGNRGMPKMYAAHHLTVIPE